MNRPALTPAQIIERARARLLEANCAARLDMLHDTAIGAINTLEDLRLIDLDCWRALLDEFEALADSRRPLLEGGAQ